MLYSFLIVSLAICICDLFCERLGISRIRFYVLSFAITAILQPSSFLLFSESNVYVAQLVMVTGSGLMLWFVYLNIVQAISSSLRIRVLMEISSHNNALDLSELVGKYNDHDLTMIRLSRLKNSGMIYERFGKIYLKSQKLAQTARFFSLLKQLVLGERSQFDTSSPRKRR